MAEKHISTTALARLLGKESKELFILLTGSGWIVKVDDHWQLTEKGKFEGGVYASHPKYGEYIAWPESIQHHHLLTLLPEAPLSATNLGYKWNIPARMVNLLLAEKNLIKKHIRGWLLTGQGRALGGQQHEAEQSAIPFVTWPETLIDQPELTAIVLQLHGDESLGEQAALDGHTVNNGIQRRINNWLYLNRIVHARNYRFTWSTEDFVDANFYIPEAQLCVECWSTNAELHENQAAAINNNLEKYTLYKTHKVAYIEFRDENINQIDEILMRELFRRGLAIW